MNNNFHTIQAGLSGNYVFGAYEPLIHDELSSGLLLRVLPEWYAFEMDFYIVSKKIYHVKRNCLLILYMSVCAILQLTDLNICSINDTI